MQTYSPMGTRSRNASEGSSSTRLVLAVLTVVTVVGAVASWRAVEEVEEAWLQQIRIADYTSFLKTRFDRSVDDALGFRSIETPADDEETEILSDLAALSEETGIVSAEEDQLLSTWRRIVDRAEINGGVDEQDIVEHKSAFTRWERDYSEPANDRISGARDRFRWTVIIWVVVSGALVAALLLLNRPTAKLE